MKVIGYARVSTVEQAATGYGLAAQEHTIAELCDRRDWELIDIVRDEGESGKDLDRPGLHSALERLAAGDAEGIVVSKLDRLSRSVVDFGLLLEWCETADVRLVALDLGVDTSSPGGRLVANVFASVAEWERDTIAARTREGLAAVRASGRPISRAAVGDEPELARRIREMREAGLTRQAICDALNSEGVPTPRGGSTWRPSSIQTVTGYRRRRRWRKIASLPEIVPRRVRR